MESRNGYGPSGASSPVGLLPSEILSEIFITALNLTKQLSYARLTLPATLSLVSKEWQELALNTAALWTTVFVCSDERTKVSNLRRRLELSKGYPIDVNISRTRKWIRVFWDGNEQILEDYLQALRPHRARIWSLNAMLRSPLIHCLYSQLLGSLEAVSPTGYVGTQPSLKPMPVSNVRHIFLSCLGTTKYPVHVPSLRKIELFEAAIPNLVFSPESLTTFSGGCSGVLTRLDLYRPVWDASTWSHFLSLLTQNPGLQILSLADANWPVQGPSSAASPPISLPSLYFLHLYRVIITTGAQAQDIFSVIDTPNLKDVSLNEVGVDPAATPSRELFKSVQRICFCGSIVIEDVVCLSAITHMALIECHHEHIIALERFMDLGNTFPSSLTPTGEVSSDTRSPKFPQLHTLTSLDNPLFLIIGVLRARPSNIHTVQIFSEDLLWRSAENVEIPLEALGRGEVPITPKEHLQNLEWLTSSFRVMVWGPLFRISDLCGPIGSSEEIFPVVLRLYEKLCWVDDESEVWKGQKPT